MTHHSTSTLATLFSPSLCNLQTPIACCLPPARPGAGVNPPSTAVVPPKVDTQPCSWTGRGREGERERDRRQSQAAMSAMSHVSLQDTVTLLDAPIGRPFQGRKEKGRGLLCDFAHTEAEAQPGVQRASTGASAGCRPPRAKP